MSNPNPTSPSTTAHTPSPRPDLTIPYRNLQHNTSLSLLVLAPILIALPPRKLDLYTFSLLGAWGWSGNHLLRERTGTGFVGFLASRRRGIGKDESGEKRLLDEGSTSTSTSTLDDRIKGKVGSDWKAERLRAEREKLAAGEGYGDMITDQIWEVWTWGEKKAETLKEDDEKVLKARRREREFPTIGKG